MIDWKKYENKIVAMDKEGLSSTQIAKILSETTQEVNATDDRQIRSVLQRYRKENNIEQVREPAKILVFDIETAPLVTYLWNRFQNYIKDDMIIKDWYVICWSAKWLFDDNVISASVTPKESIARDDKRIVKQLWELLNEADVVITHNGDKFDIKKMNGRFVKYGLNLPMPYNSIDTFKAARKKLSLPSLSLNYIAKYLGLDQKLDTNFELWTDAMEGKSEALDKMQKYCDQDVRVLEDVYLHLRPFIQPHPNLGMYIASDAITCPSCGGNHLKKEGEYATTVNIYDAFRCQDCGSITRSRKSSISKEEKQSITSSVPR